MNDCVTTLAVHVRINLWLNIDIMTVIRPSAKILSAHPAQVGPSDTVLRPLPQPHLRHVGPFIMLDHFGPRTLGPGETMEVPEHPHAGFQTVTYLFSGHGKHTDSYGGEKIILPGGVNWMTAGRGIVHEEEIGPEDPEEEGEYEGLQIWVNLPAKYKRVDAGFDAYAADELPVVEVDGGELRVIAGSYRDALSPVHVYSPLFLYHLNLDAEYGFRLPADARSEVGLYTVEGSVMLGNQRLEPNQLAVYPTQEGDVDLFATSPTRLMIFGGEPLGEKMASYGPFVMNTMDEIREIMDAYQRGEFGTL